MNPVSHTINTFYNYFNYLTLDKRALGLFRIALGFSILYNLLIVKWNYLTTLLGSNPMVPFELLDKISKGLDYSIFSFAQLRADWFLNTYYWIFVLVAILFTIGVKSRIMAILICVLQFNIMQATNAILTGVDYYNLHLIFWSIFLPINEYYAVIRSNKTQQPSLSISFVLLLQIGCIYFFSALFKYGIPWKEGFAVNIMLSDSMNVWGLGHWMQGKSYLYEPFTYLTLLIEFCLIGLIFIKWRWQTLRIIASFSLIIFHLSILLVTDTSGFSFSGIAVGLVLLPTSFFKFKEDSVIKNNVHIITQWQKNSLLILSLICSVIIVQRCLYAYYRSADDVMVLSRMEKVMIPSLAKSSISYQYWSMYAPNPPKHLGYFSILKKVKNITNKSIEAETVYNSKSKKLKDWESATLYLLRQNIEKLQQNSTSKNIFSFWLEWKIKNLKEYNNDMQDFIFMEVRIIANHETKEQTFSTDTLYYYAEDILIGNFKSIAQ